MPSKTDTMSTMPSRRTAEQEAAIKAAMMVILSIATPVGTFQYLTRSRLNSEVQDSTHYLAMMTQDHVGDHRWLPKFKDL